MNVKLRLVHTADTHGSSEVYKALNSVLSDSTDVLLDAGDALKGSNTIFCRDEPNLRRLSDLGCAAMAMGNRELHYLPSVLELRASQRDFPLLAANLVDLKGRPTTWREGTTVDRGGCRIGIFGMTVVQYPVGSPYERLFGLRFLPPESLIESLVRRYQESHDVVIFLSHLGIKKDRELIHQLIQKPELKLDFILGGHSHSLMKEPERHGCCFLSHVGAHSQGYGLWELHDNRAWTYRYHPVVEVVSAKGIST